MRATLRMNGGTRLGLSMACTAVAGLLALSLPACFGSDTPGSPNDAAAGPDDSTHDDGAATDGAVPDAGSPTGDGGTPDGGATTMDGSGGDSDGSSCASPETTFGHAVQGDPNPSFTSGVVARTANDLFIFSYFYGPDPVGDSGASVQAVYAQAFDPTTGNSKGPAAPLFTVPITPGGGQGVSSAAVAPTGQIALVYYDYDSGSGGLWAAFLDSAGDAGGGAAGLQVLHQVELEPLYFDGADPAHVIWSNASQSFVISWVGNPNGVQESVAKFLPNGQPTGGGAAVVPTDDNGTVQGEPAYVGEGSSGESNDLLGVYYESALAGYRPALTILDLTGNQVGQPIYLAAGIPNGGWGTLAGTAQGFVSVFNPPQATQTSVVFVPLADGGVVTNDAGTFPTVAFPGTPAGEGRAISDDVGPGARGGVGVALFESTSSITFAYVSADGATFEGPVSPFAATNVPGYGYSMSTYNGSFIVGAFNDQTGSTTAAASGCP